MWLLREDTWDPFQQGSQRKSNRGRSGNLQRFEWQSGFLKNERWRILGRWGLNSASFQAEFPKLYYKSPCDASFWPHSFIIKESPLCGKTYLTTEDYLVNASYFALLNAFGFTSSRETVERDDAWANQDPAYLDVSKQRLWAIRKGERKN